MTTADEILNSIFTDGVYRQITQNILKGHRYLTDDIMQDTYIVLWENKHRLNLVDCYNKSPDIIRAIYWRWCYFTYSSNSTRAKYRIDVKNVSVTDSTLFQYQFVPDEDEKQEADFEAYLFKDGLRPSDNDNEEEHYYKGLLREHFGVSYDATGKLVNTEWKSTRTIGELTKINYVTVSKDLKEGIKYIYKAWER